MDLEIERVFIDICHKGDGEYLGRIRIQLNEDIKSHPAMRNFLSLIQGSRGSSYKGVDFGTGRNSFGGVNPVILPSKDENRHVDEWKTNLGDIMQCNPDCNDANYSRIQIMFNKISTTSPKLGSVIKSDLKFLQELKSKNPPLKVSDCGIMID